MILAHKITFSYIGSSCWNSYTKCFAVLAAFPLQITCVYSRVETPLKLQSLRRFTCFGNLIDVKQIFHHCVYLTICFLMCSYMGCHKVAVGTLVVFYLVMNRLDVINQIIFTASGKGAVWAYYVLDLHVNRLYGKS
jgi:hypothetical protein